MPAAKKRKPPKTEILRAVENNRADELNRLLDAGADSNAKDGRRVDGKTPLHIACMNGCPEVVHLLLSHGADVNMRDGEGATPLYYACEKNDATLIRRDSSRPEDHLDIARALIAAGADVNAADWRFSYSPLHRACIKDHVELVVFLLSHGADVNAPDARGRTPLYMAYHSCFAIVQALIEAGANVNAKDIHGHTTLHHAAGDGRIDILQLLIEHGAGVNARSNTGLTPLHTACREGKPAAARLLMASGACMEARGSDSYSPLELALSISPSDNPAREELIELFREHAPDLVMEAYCTRSPQL